MAASDGCSENPPTRTQFWLPLTVVPATSTRSRAPNPTTSSGHARAFHPRTGTRAASTASGRPIAANVACLAKIVYEECSERSDSTLELESTMTSPITSSAIVDPSTR